MAMHFPSAAERYIICSDVLFHLSGYTVGDTYFPAEVYGTFITTCQMRYSSTLGIKGHLGALLTCVLLFCPSCSWYYTLSTNLWCWVSGVEGDATAAMGSYGAYRVPSPSNSIPPRVVHAGGIDVAAGIIYIHGGYTGDDNSRLADVWSVRRAIIFNATQMCYQVRWYDGETLRSLSSVFCIVLRASFQYNISSNISTWIGKQILHFRSVSQFSNWRVTSRSFKSYLVCSCTCQLFPGGSSIPAPSASYPAFKNFGVSTTAGGLGVNALAAWVDPSGGFWYGFGK